MSRPTAWTPGPGRDDGDGVATTAAERARVLLGAASAPVVGGYALVATVLTLVTMLAPRAEFSGWDVLLASGPAWLAVYQVPLELSGAELGMLPLLPTAGAAVLVARAAVGAVHRLGELRPSPIVPVVVTITGAHAVVAGIVVVGSAGTGVHVDPLRGVGTPMLLSGVFAVVGALRARTAPEWAAPSRGPRFDPVALRGIRAGLLGLVALCTGGALVVLVATGAAFPRVAASFADTAPEVGSAAGVTVLSVLYLPNVVLLGLGFVTGPGFSVGLVSVNPFGLTSGPVPPLPLLAGVPGSWAAWWPVWLVLPAAVGLLVGRSLRDVSPDRGERLRAVLVAAVCVGLATVLVGPFAGGAVGGGTFDPVSVRVELTSIAAFGWVLVPGVAGAWHAGPGRRKDDRRGGRRPGPG